MGIGHGDHSQIGTISLLDRAVGAIEANDLRVLPGVVASLRLQRFGQQVLVHEAYRREDVCDQFVVHKSDEHIRGVVPHEAVHHGTKLFGPVAVHRLRQIQILVLVQDGDLAIDPSALLAQRDAHNVKLMLDRLTHGPSRVDVKDADLLGRGGIHHGHCVTADAQGLRVEVLRPQAAELDGRQGAPLVRDDLDAVGIHEGKVKGALNDQRSRLLEVLYVRGVPVGLLVDEALAVRSDDKSTKGQRHVRDTVAEVQLLLRLIEDVVHRDGVSLIENHVSSLPGEDAVD
mmetsp:Transcript_86696/g.176437  ORF Transcript_86696/g.176437 Transcript_86696/m.176437 type:complete len:287 (-) Transcript_86696:414-1274(-)